MVLNCIENSVPEVFRFKPSFYVEVEPIYRGGIVFAEHNSSAQLATKSPSKTYQTNECKPAIINELKAVMTVRIQETTDNPVASLTLFS